MLHSRIERESIEDSGLAPAACRSAASRGRKYPEPPHSYRSEFQRDRDRVIHCRAFRRLEYKTQVFVNGTADHYRTRLTHTIEMAAVGRTMARALRLNEDLTEAIALAHDIGHSPFGHSGEYALNELMKDHGGFDHNVQSLRWVEQLERRYPDFPGLNLTWETRAGLRKHLAQAPGAELDGTAIGPFQCLEAQVADVADDLTYHAHDVDDGLEAGLLNEEMLDSLELWREAARLVRQQYGRLGERERLAMTVRGLLDIQVQDALDHTAGRLARHRPQSPDEAMWPAITTRRSN
jgi:dGTPase